MDDFVVEPRKHCVPSTALLSVDSMRALALTAGEMILLQQRECDGGALLSVLEAWPSTKPARGRVFVHPNVARLAPRTGASEGRLRLVVRPVRGSERLPPAAELFLTAILPPALCDGGRAPAEGASAMLKRCVRAAVRSRFSAIAPSTSVLVQWCGETVAVRVDRARLCSGIDAASAQVIALRSDTRIAVAVLGADADDAPQPPTGIAATAAAAATATTDITGAAGSTDITAGVVGGLEHELSIVLEIAETALRRPEEFARLGVRPLRGVLLHGPPGTGKTLLARLAAQRCDATLVCINGADIIGQFVGESEQRLRNAFARAVSSQPAIIFLDEIDALCAARTASSEDFERRVVTTLLALLDGLCAPPPSPQGTLAGAGAAAPPAPPVRVMVLAATNRPEALDPALRRPGRLDRDLEFGAPDAGVRFEIVRAIIARMGVAGAKLLAEDEEALRDVSRAAHGYVGADLAALCREAALNAVRRAAASSSAASASEEELCISREDLQVALKRVGPSALREVRVAVPPTRWSDIGGQEEAKKRLREAVEWPLHHADAFIRMGIRPPKGLLLYGPPGCSKTLMAKALAGESEMNFIAVKGPELFSKWVGESEKALKEIFRKARRAAPSIVFFDEIDALAVRRGSSSDGGTSVGDRVLSQLLQELDGVHPLKRVVVVAATNRPDVLDPALLRPGRIDRVLLIGLPDIEGRRAIFRIHLRSTPTDADVVIDAVGGLADRAEGYSGAEIAAVCREAAVAALEEDIDAPTVHLRHFDVAMKRVTPRTTREMLDFYAAFESKRTSS